MKAYTHNDVNPFIGENDGIMIGRNGELTIGYELFLPPIFTISKEIHDAFVEKFIQGVKILPNYCRVHRQDFIIEKNISFKEYDEWNQNKSFFDEEYIKTFSRRPVLSQKSYIYFTLIPKIYHNISVINANMIKSRGTIEINKSLVSEFVNQVEQFIALLSSVINQAEEGQPPYITCRKLTPADFLRSISSPSDDGVLAKYLFLGDPRYSDIAYSPKSGTLKVGEKNVEIYSISSLDNVPTEISSYINYDTYNLPTCWAAYLSPIIKFPHILNTYVIKGDPEKEKDSLERHKNFLKAFSLARSNLKGYEEIEEFLNLVEEEKASIVDIHVNVIVWDEKPRDLGVKRQSISAMLSSLGCQNPKIEIYNKMNMFLASLPGNAINIFEEYRFKAVDIVAAIMCNFVSLQKSNTSGKGLKVIDRLSKSPIKINLDEPYSKGFNMNMFALGGSGAGKSFAMNHIINNELKEETHVLIIDIGKSYEFLCSFWQGKWFEFSDEDPLSFNPFILSEYDWQKTENTLADEKLQALSGIIKVLWKGPEGTFTQTESNLVKELLISYYRSDIPRNFNTFYEYTLEYQFDYTNFDKKEFFYNLKTCYKEGSYPKLLNAKSHNSLLNEKLIVFELDNIKGNPMLLSITTTVIMDAFVAKMRNIKGKKIIMFDEAWAALSNDEMSGLIQWLAKTARKFNSKLIVVTQELNDILTSKVGKALINNCSEKLLLDLSNFKENFDEIQSILSLNDFQKAQILSINKGKEAGDKSRDFYIGFQYGKSTVVELAVSRAEALLYTSSQEEKNAIRYVADKFNISYSEAIKYIIQNFIEDIGAIQKRTRCNFYQAIKSLI